MENTEIHCIFCHHKLECKYPGPILWIGVCNCKYELKLHISDKNDKFQINEYSFIFLREEKLKYRFLSFIGNEWYASTSEICTIESKSDDDYIYPALTSVNKFIPYEEISLDYVNRLFSMKTFY